MSDLNQLQTFIEVARRRSFSAAGRALSLPRSTVSARIKTLEQRLQTQLFLRNTRQVVLTPEGEQYWHQCQQALTQLQQAEEALLSEQQLGGKVTLSIPVGFPALNITTTLRRFMQQHPAIQLFVDVSDVSRDLLNGEADVAIRGRDPGDRDLVARQLGDVALCYVATPSWWQQHKHLAGQQPPAERHNWLEQQLLFAPGGVSQSAPLSGNSFELALQWARDGLGPALLPRTLCADACRANELLTLPFTSPSALPLYLVYAGRQLPRRVRLLVDFLMAQPTLLITPESSSANG